MKELNQYYKACENLAEKFLSHLYNGDKLNYDDASWVGDKTGEILAWGDWYVDMNLIADYFKYELTSDEFFDWYDNYVDENKDNINMKNWKLLTNN